MKARLIFDESARVVLEPATDKEQALLGAFLLASDDTLERSTFVTPVEAAAHVTAELAGHFTNRRVARVTIELRSLPPTP